MTRQRITCVALVACMLATACAQWKEVAPSDVIEQRVEIRTRRARVSESATSGPASTYLLRVDRIVAPGLLEGWDEAGGLERRVDLRGAPSLQVELPDPAATGTTVFLVVTGGILLVVGGLLISLYGGIG